MQCQDGSQGLRCPVGSAGVGNVQKPRPSQVN